MRLVLGPPKFSPEENCRSSLPQEAHTYFISIAFLPWVKKLFRGQMLLGAVRL